MFLDTGYIWVAMVSLACVVAVVLVHYEVASLLSRLIDRRSAMAHRPRILVLLFGLLLAHLFEVLIFGLSATALMSFDGVGDIVNPVTDAPLSVSLLDLVYLSLVTYSTLGYGDIVPSGPISLLFGIESLMGFMLITWSASIIFIEMQKHWKPAK